VLDSIENAFKKWDKFVPLPGILSRALVCKAFLRKPDPVPRMPHRTCLA